MVLKILPIGWRVRLRLGWERAIPNRWRVRFRVWRARTRARRAREGARLQRRALLWWLGSGGAFAALVFAGVAVDWGAFYQELVVRTWTGYSGLSGAAQVEAFRNLLWGLGVFIAAFVGLPLAMIRTVSQNRSTRIEARRHLMESFARAVEQLGSTEFSVRLGAILALERLAQESPILHGPIVEALCAYVREKTRAPAETDAGANGAKKTKSSGDGERSSPDVDIQAILTAIGRRNRRHERTGAIVDLRGADLRRADLTGAQLEGARLAGSSLNAAILSGAHLEGADLLGTHLEGAILVTAHLEGAKLYRAHLKDADLSGAHLEGANLVTAHLEDAILVTAHLKGAILWEAHLEGANLFRAHLQSADLSEAHLEGARLQGAHLDGADLKDVWFDQRTNVSGADLSKAKGLPPAFRATVRSDKRTKWPRRRPARPRRHRPAKRRLGPLT